MKVLLLFSIFLLLEVYCESLWELLLEDAELNYGTFQEFSSETSPGPRHGSMSWYAEDNLFLGFGSQIIINHNKTEKWDSRTNYFNDMFKLIEAGSDSQWAWWGGTQTGNSDSNFTSEGVNGFNHHSFPCGRVGSAVGTFTPSKSLFLIGGGRHIATIYKSYATGKLISETFNDVWAFGYEEEGGDYSGWRRIFDNKDNFEDDYPEENTFDSYSSHNLDAERYQMSEREFASFAQGRDNSSNLVYIYGGIMSAEYEPTYYMSNQSFFNSTNNVTTYFMVNESRQYMPPVFLGDVWLFDMKVEKFKLLKPNRYYREDSFVLESDVGETNPSNTPSQRAYAYCWLDVASGNLYIFGGMGYGGFMSDMWRFNLEERQWAIVKKKQWQIPNTYGLPGVFNETNTPSSRRGGISWRTQRQDGGEELFLLMGGMGNLDTHSSIGYMNDVWEFSIDKEQWMLNNDTKTIKGVTVEEDGEKSVPVLDFSTSVLSDTGELFLYGGLSAGVDQSSLWKFSKYSSMCNYRQDVVDNSCVCKAGYYNAENDNGTIVYTDTNGTCSTFFCYNISNAKPDEVCSNKQGLCIEPDNCQCYDQYYGDKCQYHMCYDIEYTDENVCGGHGKCEGANDCDCVDGLYEGKECQEYWGEYAYLQTSGSSIIITIDFRVSYSLVKDWLDNSFIDCSEMVDDAENVLGKTFKDENNPENLCSVDTDNLLTTTLRFRIVIFSNDSTVAVGDGITLKPHFRTTHKFTRKVVEVVSNTEESNPRYEIIIIIVALLVTGIFCCLILFLIGLVCCAFVYVILLQKRLKNNHALNVLFDMEDAEKEMIDHLRVNEKLFEIPYSDLKVKEMIGQGGGQALIFRCYWKDKEVAFKCFRITDIADENGMTEFENEIGLLASLSHPNILSFYGAVLEQNRIGIIIEYCRNGSIKSYLKKHPIGLLEKLRIVRDIAGGLEFLHQRNVVHRDIKSENILLDDNLNPKLIDFGVSKIFEAKSVEHTRRVGTSVYMSPEVTKGEKYTELCDIFSFGVMMFEIIKGDFNPYPDVENLYNIEFRVALDPTFRPNVSSLVLPDEDDWIGAVISQCWEAVPENRPTSKILAKILADKYRETAARIGKEAQGSMEEEIVEEELLDEVDELEEKIEKEEVETTTSSSDQDGEEEEEGEEGDDDDDEDEDEEEEEED